MNREEITTALLVTEFGEEAARKIAGLGRNKAGKIVGLIFRRSINPSPTDEAQRVLREALGSEEGRKIMIGILSTDSGRAFLRAAAIQIAEAMEDDASLGGVAELLETYFPRLCAKRFPEQGTKRTRFWKACGLDGLPKRSGA